MSAREIGALPAVISELVNLSIDTVKPFQHVGRVLIFDVLPHKRQDPPLIFCSALDLSEYYFLWAQVIARHWPADDRLLSLYDEMIKALKIDTLQTDEAAYMIIELLKFKNEYVRRA